MFSVRYSLYDTAIHQPATAKQGEGSVPQPQARSACVLGPAMYSVKRRREGGRCLQQPEKLAPEAARRQPPELDLLLLCARWPQRDEDRQLIRELSARPLDWQRFLLLAQHHRLVPLVSHNLQASVGESPSPALDAVLNELREFSRDNAHQALHSLAELRRVVQELRARAIPVRVLKGLPLAQCAFGELGLRSTGDIDLLIDDSSILEADRVLRGFGYYGLFQLERFTPRQFSFYRTHWRDNAYQNSATGFEIDLHWRLFRNSRMPGADLCATPAGQSISFGGFQVETLPQRENLLYLCVHGTFDGWLFLKSLADVAAQVRTMSEPELDELAILAEGYGILPELSAALTLVCRYLAMDHWSARLLTESDPTVSHSLRYADRALVQGGFLAGRGDIPHFATMAFEFGLRRNLRYRRELLLRVLYRARMWQTFPLPDYLFGLYPMLSPVEWVYFRMRQKKAPSG